MEKSRDLHKMIIHNPAPIKRDLLTAREIYFFLLTLGVLGAAVRLEHISHQPVQLGWLWADCRCLDSSSWHPGAEGAVLMGSAAGILLQRALGLVQPLDVLCSALPGFYTVECSTAALL